MNECFTESEGVGAGRKRAKAGYMHEAVERHVREEGRQKEKEEEERRYIETHTHTHKGKGAACAGGWACLISCTGEVSRLVQRSEF